MPKYLDESGLTRFYDNIADRPVHTFDTVAEMQAATYLEDGMTCHTNGFHASGDGGAAYYTVGASGTANGMDVLALQGGLFAMLVVTEPYVTPEMFGGAGDGITINDSAFKAAVESGHDVAFMSGGTYLFSGSLIDLASVGRRIVFYGNDAVVSNLSFRYNITSSNGRAVTSGVQSFNICFRDLRFINNESPILITTGNVSVERCNFTNCTYCFGFPEFYVDYFHAEDCYFYNTANFISPFGYDGSATSVGMYGDWITFDRCSFSHDTLVYASAAGHSSTVTVRNCLHGHFVLTQTSSINRSYFIFEKCHHEGHDGDPTIVTVDGTLIPSRRAVTFRDTYFYSEAVPDNLDGMTFERCTINYGNLGNYKAFACESGSFERSNIFGIVWFDETEFAINKAESPTANNRNSTVQMSSNTTNLQTYDAAHVVKYTAATSLESGRLYFNGLSAPITWSEDGAIQIGKCPVFNAYLDRSLLKNVYLHVFKVMDDVTYRSVVPVTHIIRQSDTTSSLTTYLQIADEPEGVWGCPWEEYSGTIEYITT